MILVLGGTHEGREISTLLNEQKLPYVLSVTTELGFDLYHDTAAKCIIAKFSASSLDQFIEENKVNLIIDATHPHAGVIKDIARQCSEQHAIPYWRYERKITAANHTSKCYDSFATITDAIMNLKIMLKPDEKILVTGTKHIPEFIEAFDINQCVFRIMPGIESMRICINHGIPIQNIIAIKAPCSIKMNQCIFEDFNISYFVFKNSGSGSAFESNVYALSGTDVKGIVIEPKTIVVDTVIDSVFALKEALTNYHPH